MMTSHKLGGAALIIFFITSKKMMILLSSHLSQESNQRRQSADSFNGMSHKFIFFRLINRNLAEHEMRIYIYLFFEVERNKEKILKF